MPNDAYTAMIDAAATDNGIEVRNQFNDLMLQQVADAIAGKKVELAQQQFKGNFNIDANQNTVDTPNTEVEDEIEDEPEETETTNDEPEEIEVDLSDDEIEDFLNDINDAEEEEKNG